MVGKGEEIWQVRVWGLCLENMINPGSLNAANPITWFTEHSHIQKLCPQTNTHTHKSTVYIIHKKN